MVASSCEPQLTADSLRGPQTCPSASVLTQLGVEKQIATAEMSLYSAKEKIMMIPSLETSHGVATAEKDGYTKTKTNDDILSEGVGRTPRTMLSLRYKTHTRDKMEVTPSSQILSKSLHYCS